MWSSLLGVLCMPSPKRVPRFQPFGQWPADICQPLPVDRLEPPIQRPFILIKLPRFENSNNTRRDTLLVKKPAQSRLPWCLAIFRCNLFQFLNDFENTRKDIRLHGLSNSSHSGSIQFDTPIARIFPSFLRRSSSPMVSTSGISGDGQYC